MMNIAEANVVLDSLCDVVTDPLAGESLRQVYKATRAYQAAFENIGSVTQTVETEKLNAPLVTRTKREGTKDVAAIIVAAKADIQAVIDTHASESKPLKASDLYVLIEQYIPGVTVSQFKVTFGVVLKEGHITGIKGVLGRNGGYYKVPETQA